MFFRIIDVLRFMGKEMSSCNKLNFLIRVRVFATRCRRHLFFQTMNSVRSNNIIFYYYRFPSSGCKNIGIRKFELVAKLISFVKWIESVPQTKNLWSLYLCNLIMQTFNIIFMDLTECIVWNIKCCDIELQKYRD